MKFLRRRTILNNEEGGGISSYIVLNSMEMAPFPTSLYLKWYTFNSKVGAAPEMHSWRVFLGMKLWWIISTYPTLILRLTPVERGLWSFTKTVYSRTPSYQHDLCAKWLVLQFTNSTCSIPGQLATIHCYSVTIHCHSVVNAHEN